MDVKVLLAEINDYANKCWRKINTHYNYYTYGYSSDNRKFKMLDGLLTDIFLDIEEKRIGLGVVAFLMKIINELEFSRDFGKAAVIRLSARRMSGVCSERTYKKYKDYLLSIDVLVATSNANWFIVNPRYVSKFYKQKVYMTDEQFIIERQRRGKKS